MLPVSILFKLATRTFKITNVACIILDSDVRDSTDLSDQFKMYISKHYNPSERKLFQKAVDKDPSQAPIEDTSYK